jgi:alpha-tubulin suppressor-like RCC1 family protein
LASSGPLAERYLEKCSIYKNSNSIFVKVLYSGKGSSLGLKQTGGVVTGTGKWSRWSELPVTKSPRINHLAVGHEGLHAVLVTEEGAVFFMGTARRGEDGDQSKSFAKKVSGVQLLLFL